MIPTATRDTAVKALGSGKIAGYLAVWGTPETKDLQGEYFTAKTNFELDWYNQRPGTLSSWFRWHIADRSYRSRYVYKS